MRAYRSDPGLVMAQRYKFTKGWPLTSLLKQPPTLHPDPAPGEINYFSGCLLINYFIKYYLNLHDVSMMCIMCCVVYTVLTKLKC